MTAPEQPPPPPPERPPPAQVAAVTEALESDISALIPATTAAILAIIAYARTGQRIVGVAAEIAEKVGYGVLVTAALTALAQRNLELQRRLTGRRGAEELFAHEDVAVQAGVAAGLETFAQAAASIAASVREDEAAGISPPGVSLPGEPYDPTPLADQKDSQSYADPEKLALPVVQSTKHAAQLAAAEEAGWRYKAWITTGDNRVRPAHAFLGSPKYEFHAVPLLEPFVDIDDNKLWYPGDTSAPVSTWIRCRCWLRLSR